MSLINLGGIPVPEHGSFSQLTTFMECEVKHRIGRSKLIPETPAWYLIGGTAMHAAVEEWERVRCTANEPDLYGPSTLTHLFEQKFAAGIYEAEQAEPDRAKWRAAKRGAEDENFWRRMAPNWCKTYAKMAYWQPLTDQNGQPALELKFDLQLGGVHVTGFIDQVLQWQGETKIRDLKFGSSDGNPLQLGLYRVAMAECYGYEIHMGEFWNPRKKSVIDTHGLRMYSKEYFDRLLSSFDARRELDPWPNLGRHCGWCEFNSVCPWYQPESEGPFDR